MVPARSDPPEVALAISRSNTCITSATDSSCHYSTVHRHYRQFDKQALAAISDSTVETLKQDIKILELTQKNMEFAPITSVACIHVDEEAVKSRRSHACRPIDTARSAASSI